MKGITLEHPMEQFGVTKHVTRTNLVVFELPDFIWFEIRK